MSRIQDLGEACDDAIKALRRLMEENGALDAGGAAVQLWRALAGQRYTRLPSYTITLR